MGIDGGFISEEVRFDDRGKRNRDRNWSFFGAEQVLREHAVTTYGEKGENGPFYYDRLDEGIAHLEATLAALPGPVDGLVGFSQGANMSALLCARSARECEHSAPPFRCVVLLENDKPGWAEQKAD